jgi:hypothetical protein
MVNYITVLMRLMCTFFWDSNKKTTRININNMNCITFKKVSNFKYLRINLNEKANSHKKINCRIAGISDISP